MDTTGLEGAMQTAWASERAASTAGPGREASAPSKRTAATATSWCSRTKYSWNVRSRPSAVVTLVRSGSSVTGSTRSSRPQVRAISAVTSVRVAPERSRDVRYRCVPRSRSPRENHPAASLPTGSVAEIPLAPA